MHVIVIGAGVIGSSIALQLTRAGNKVTVIDRNPAAGLGSTSASSAVVRFNYSTFDAVMLAWESYFLWKQWQSLGAEISAALNQKLSKEEEAQIADYGAQIRQACSN